jgi:hypothetical protein
MTKDEKEKRIADYDRWLDGYKRKGQDNMALYKATLKAREKLAHGTQGKLFEKNPKRNLDLNELKSSYLRLAARYLREGKEDVGRQASLLQSEIQRKLSKEEYRSFINTASRAFQRGKVKSKVLLTLLKELDNDTSIRYNPGKLNSSLKALTDRCDENEIKISDLYEKFHHFKPTKIESVDLKVNQTKDGIMHVMKLGMMPEMVYISDKDINDDGSREKISYIHKFRKFLPIYTDGNVFIIPAEKQDITERGLIYNGKKRVMNPPVKRRKK